MSADELSHTLEDAERAAKNLKVQLRKAKALVDEARDRLERQAVEAQLAPGTPISIAEGGES